VDVHQRTQLLRHLVETERWSRVLVFVATQHAADTVAEKLRKARISAEPFHGALSQGKRTQVLADFKLSRVKVVVATDLAARGLDITDLPVVVNHDLPRSAEDYTHRMGRTGRAGASGLAVSFVSPDTEAHLRLIEKRHGLSLKREVVRGFEPGPTAPATAQAPQATQGLDPNGGIKGKRPSKKDKLRAESINKDS
jgi:superfamily II DNA/RNA helicase